MNDNIILNKNKDEFIRTTLLPYCLQRIEFEEDNNIKVSLKKEVASMRIFPYITKTGTQIGCLKEKGINWYYVDDSDNYAEYSTLTYRILDKGILRNNNIFKTLTNIYGSDGCGYILKFSNDIVVKELVRLMSVEQDYTEVWWKYAMDAFPLWDFSKNPGNELQVASQNAYSRRYFLFTGDYCVDTFRALLDKFNIYHNICETSGYKYFMKRYSSRKQDAIRFLKYLGIPNSFIYCDSKDDLSLDKNIKLIFDVMKIKQYDFISMGDEAYELCELVNYIFFNVIANENEKFTKELLENTSFLESLVVRNVNNQYMSLNHDMFYIDDKVDSQPSDYRNHNMNRFLVNRCEYKDELLEAFSYKMSDVRKYDDYNFGSYNVTALAFYQWVWQYINHQELINNILSHLTNIKSLTDINNKNQSFILDILEKNCNCVDVNIDGKTEKIYSPKGNVDDIQFTFSASIENIFSYYKIINAYYFSKDYDIKVVPTNKIFKREIDFKSRILSAVEDQYGVNKMDEISAMDFWQNIYYAHSSIMGNENYVIVQYKENLNDPLMNILLLEDSNNKNAHITAVCKYIKDILGIELTEVTKNWKEEYYRLATFIDDYLSKKTPYYSDEELLFMEAKTNDIATKKDEIIIWEELQKERKQLCNNMISDINFESWRNYLDMIYHGRCQICGERTVSGIDNAFFWTFRIAEKSDSSLYNYYSNLFCLCPSCHGRLKHGFLERDLSSIKEIALEYADLMNEEVHLGINCGLETSDSLVSTYANYDKEFEGFVTPITFNVKINGKEEIMKFSWNHFIRLAFLLNSIKDPKDKR